MTLREAYQILGLSTDATAAQVKAAYRRLVAETHPDRGGSAAEFIRIRAAYEILTGFLGRPPRGAATSDATAASGRPGGARAEDSGPDDDIPIPADLRHVIDSIVADFREQQRWAEEETLAHLAGFEQAMTTHIQRASRTELRHFSQTFSSSWSAVIAALFGKCNSRCDGVLQRYETWYTENTQTLFDGLYRRELLRFAFHRRFWEAFGLLVAIAGALSVAIGWDGPWRRWVSVALIALAAGGSFLVYRRSARRQRRVRGKVEPLSVVVFEMDPNARFPTERAMKKGRRTTAALGLTGMVLGNAASAGLAVPIVGAVAGAAIGGVLDRVLNPLPQLRQSMLADLQRFMAVGRPQLTTYVLEAHNELLDDVRAQIVGNYQERVKTTVRLLGDGLLTAGDGG